MAIDTDISVVPQVRGEQKRSALADFRRVAPHTFRAAVVTARETSAFHRDNLELKDHYNDHECYLSRDGALGFAISDTSELVNVFSREPRQGAKIMEFVTAAHSFLHLNCFGGGFLEAFYAGYGFRTVDRTPNWNIDGPDVVIMEYRR